LDSQTFTITVKQKNKTGITGTWTTEQLVRALLEKGSLLDVVLVIPHPIAKTKDE
jgi:hypothetical protein